jgi:hypothetical protein
MVSTVKLFIPREGSATYRAVAKGSAIIAAPTQGLYATSGDRILIYYEGNTSGSSNLDTFDLLAAVAYERARDRAGTTSKAAVPKAELLEVGIYDPVQRRCFIGGHHMEVTRWLEPIRQSLPKPLDPRIAKAFGGVLTVGDAMRRDQREVRQERQKGKQ